MSIRDVLPIHPVPPGAAAGARDGVLVTGLVERQGRVALEDIEALQRGGYTGDFRCREGWTVEALQWEGVPLAAILATAGVLPGARYVRVVSGEYVLPLSLDDAASGLLCDTLGGEPLSFEHGAPWRLLLPGGECFSSVKWVQQLDVVAEPGENTAEQIATARLRRA